MICGMSLADGSLTINKPVASEAWLPREFPLSCIPAGPSQLSLTVKNLSANAGEVRDPAQSLGGEDALEEGAASSSSTPAWRTPRAEEPGGLVRGVTKSPMLPQRLSRWAHRPAAPAALAPGQVLLKTSFPPTGTGGGADGVASEVPGDLTGGGQAAMQAAGRGCKRRRGLLCRPAAQLPLAWPLTGHCPRAGGGRGLRTPVTCRILKYAMKTLHRVSVRCSVRNTAGPNREDAVFSPAPPPPSGRAAGLRNLSSLTARPAGIASLSSS